MTTPANKLAEALRAFNVTESNIMGGTVDSLTIRVPLAAIRQASYAIALYEATIQSADGQGGGRNDFSGDGLRRKGEEYRVKSAAPPPPAQPPITEGEIEAMAIAACNAWHYAKVGTPDGDMWWLQEKDELTRRVLAAWNAAPDRLKVKI